MPGFGDVPPGLGISTALPKPIALVPPNSLAHQTVLPDQLAPARPLPTVLPGFGTTSSDAQYPQQWEAAPSTYAAYQQSAQPHPLARGSSAHPPHAQAVQANAAAQSAAAQPSSYGLRAHTAQAGHFAPPLLAGDPPLLGAQYDATMGSYQPGSTVGMENHGPALVDVNSMQLPKAQMSYGTWSELPSDSYSPGADEPPPLPDGPPPLPVCPLCRKHVHSAYFPFQRLKKSN
jgi:hypothetical protein